MASGAHHQLATPVANLLRRRHGGAWALLISRLRMDARKAPINDSWMPLPRSPMASRS